MKSLRQHYVFIGFWFAVLIMLVIRLGSTLIGIHVLTGYDMLDSFAPWSSLPTADDQHIGNPYITDQIDSQIPAAVEVRKRLGEGEWPLQSNLVAGGASLLVQPSLGYLTPTRWAWLVLPLTIAPGWVKLFEIAFGIAFTFLFSRRLGFSKISSSLAGFVFAFSGFTIAWSGWPQATVVSLVPMLFWSVERFVQERRWRDLVAVALATAFLLLGGFPIVAGHSFLLAGIYAIVRCSVASPRPWKQRARDLLMLGLGVVVGACISMVQLLPFVELTAIGSNLEYRDGWSSIQDPASSWLSLFLPTAPFTGAAFQDHSSYVGAVAFVLAAIGVLAWLRGGLPRGVGMLFVLVCVFIVAFISFQRIGNWGELINDLPLLANNPPGRLRAQLALPIALFAGLGIQWLMDEPPRKIWHNHSWMKPGFSWPAIAMSLVASSIILGLFTKYLSVEAVRQDPDLRNDVLLALIPFALTVVAIFAARFARSLKGPAILVMCTLVVVQAAGPAAFYWPKADPDEIFPDSEATDFLAENVGHNQLATAGLVLRPNVPNVYGIRLANGHGFTSPSWAEALLSTDENSFASGGTYSYLAPNRSTIFSNEKLDELGVTYVAASATEDVQGEPGVPVPLPGETIGKQTTDVEDPEPLGPSGIRVTVQAPSQAINGINIPMSITGDVVAEATAFGANGEEIATNLLYFSSQGTGIELPVGLAIPAGVTTDHIEVAITPEPIDTGLSEVRLKQTDQDQPAVYFNAITAAQEPYPLVFAGDNVLIWQRTTALDRIRLSPNVSGTEELTASEGTLNVINDTGDLIHVNTETQEDGYLAVAQSIGDAYTVRVDGQEVSLHEGASGTYTVAIPSGSHEITISFEPDSFKIGSLLTIFGLLAVLGLATVGPLRNRRKIRKDDASRRNDRQDASIASGKDTSS